MAQLEMEKIGFQLGEAQKIKQSLLRINPDLNSVIVESGSVVLTGEGNFFVAIGAGIITFDKEDYFAISPASPIARNMWGKKAGDFFSFNKKEYYIKNIV
jgi:hypothetical protein